MKKKLFIALLAAGSFTVNSCTESVFNADIEQPLLTQKNESTHRACSMKWQKKTGSVIWGTQNKSFSVVAGRSGQIYIVNDNNGSSGSNGNITVTLNLSQVDLQNVSDQNFNVPSGGTRTVLVDAFLTSSVTVTISGSGLSPTKVFAVSVGYCN